MQQLSLFPLSSPSARLMLRELPESEQPHYRLQRYGVAALSNAELVELITGAPQALGREVLTRFRGLAGLTQASLAELEEMPGLGPARAARIVSALELGRRLALENGEERLSVHSPADVANLLMPEMSFLDQEQMRVVLLNTRQYVLGVVTVYIGNVNSAIVRPAELFREAVKVNAPAIIMAHNHPSGDPSPSPQDITITKQAVSAGRTLDIDLLDHLIIGNGRYVSLKERGLGFD